MPKFIYFFLVSINLKTYMIKEVKIIFGFKFFFSNIIVFKNYLSKFSNILV